MQMQSGCLSKDAEGVSLGCLQVPVSVFSVSSWFYLLYCRCILLEMYHHCLYKDDLFQLDVHLMDLILQFLKEVNL